MNFQIISITQEKNHKISHAATGVAVVSIKNVKLGAAARCDGREFNNQKGRDEELKYNLPACSSGFS